jgi:acyl-CoA synthetase (AMP-forming)/AMP-acid ligase II
VQPATVAVPFAGDLAAYGDRTAFVTDAGELSYAELAARVREVAERLGTARRLVLVVGANTVDALVAYLAGLSGGHPVLLVPDGGTADAAIERYDPDVVIRDGDLREVRPASAHVLHDELALLLSTSGSTGSTKLVRLSHENLRSNAEAIGEYLDIRPDDRAATTLPMHYCYGLSVVNSHLARGASLLLTDRPVTDPAFWTAFRAVRATSFAGVPYTFDLLDRIGFEWMDLPHLRTVTQAGGRLAADRVRRYAELGRRRGWRFFVMYGQTEATARMAYLPPEFAAAHPDCVGVAIPGGSLHLRPLPEWPGDDVGELVYAGPNVMLGYAESAADLALGRTLYELDTGDVARRTPDGLFRIVGRLARFTKIFGLRIDLERVEANLARDGVTACCAGDGDDRLVVAVTPVDVDAGRVRRLVSQVTGLPARTIDVFGVPELPRLPNGKPDYPAVRALTRTSRPAEPDRPADLVALYAEILQRDDATGDSTFVSLGGDSLSYVEMSIRLEQALGHLPADWHTTPIKALRPPPEKATGRWRAARLETGVALRAIAIVFVVGTHATLFDIKGGAHLLLAVAGFNFARFHLTSAPGRVRARGIGRSVARIAVASMCWIAFAAVFLADNYGVEKVFLVNYILGKPGRFNDFWFVETIVYLMLASLALLAIPAVDRAERRLPFALPIALSAAGLVTRYELIPGVKLATPLLAFWLFTLGWATAKATDNRQRLFVTLAAVATIPGFHSDLPRETLMVVGLVALIWLPTVPSVPFVNRVAGVLASASLYIYLTHWQVYSRLDHHSPLLALLVSLAVGIAYAALVRGATSALRSRRDARPDRRRRSRGDPAALPTQGRSPSTG